MTPVLLSTVTPVYRGESYLRELVAELSAMRDEFEESAAPVRLSEAIFVDDESIDGSITVLRKLAAENDWVRIVRMSRNFGQHPATIAGILHSSGDWVATLDEDLQHPPADLMRLLSHAVREQCDVVYAGSSTGPHGSGLRDLSSKYVKATVAWLSANPNVRRFSSFRMIRGSIARAAASLSAHDTYLDVCLGWFTSRFGRIDLPLEDKRCSEGGQSGYSLRALAAHARRLVLSADLRVLRIGTLVGTGALAISFVGALVVLGMALLSPESIQARGWTSLFLAVLFFGGLTSLLLSILIEFMTTVVQSARGRPPFFVVDRASDAPLLEYFKGLPE